MILSAGLCHHVSSPSIFKSLSIAILCSTSKRTGNETMYSTCESLVISGLKTRLVQSSVLSGKRESQLAAGQSLADCERLRDESG